jgi:hypothetical protein
VFNVHAFFFSFQATRGITKRVLKEKKEKHLPVKFNCVQVCGCMRNFQCFFVCNFLSFSHIAQKENTKAIHKIQTDD